MIESIYSFFLLYTNNNNIGFEIVCLQTNHTFILSDHIFAATEEKKLKKAKVFTKKREKQKYLTPINLYSHYITLANDNSSFFAQKIIASRYVL